MALSPIDYENLLLPCLLEGSCWQALRSPADLHHERPRWCDWPRCPRPSCSLIHQSTACIRKKNTSDIGDITLFGWKTHLQWQNVNPRFGNQKKGGPSWRGEMAILLTWQQQPEIGEWASHTLSLSLKLSWISQGKTHLRQPNLTANLALKADNLEEKTEKFDVANLLHPRLNLSYSGDHHGQRRCEAVGETSHHQADHVLLTYSTSGPWCLGRI